MNNQISEFKNHMHELLSQARNESNYDEYMKIRRIILLINDVEAGEATIEEIEHLIERYNQKQIEKVSKVEHIREQLADEPDVFPELDPGALEHLIKHIRDVQPVPLTKFRHEHEMFLFTALTNKLIDIDEGMVYLSSNAYEQLLNV